MRPIAFAVVTGMLGVAGCIRASLVECDDGRLCAVGLVCDTAHDSCVSPDQLSVCDGAVEDADCDTGSLTGGCLDGVCLPRGCGNGVVESDEVCDDRNQTSGDGCRGDCRSDERCGNGVTDGSETCDDGNLMSRDGCDSRCLAETVRWTTFGISPRRATRAAAYDEVRKRLVYRLVATTWEWDGARWTAFASPRALQGNGNDLYPADAGVAYFDPDRGKVVWVGKLEGIASNGLYAWNGATWSQISAGVPPIADIVSAIYDPVRHRPVMVMRNGSIAWTIDPAGAWQQLPGPGVDGFRSKLGFDPVAGVVVYLAAGVELTFDGASWTTTGPLSAAFGWTMAYNPVRGRLAAFDGVMREREGGAWVLVPGGNGAPGMPDPAFFFDRTVDRPVAFTRDATTVETWNGTWSGIDLRTTGPFGIVSIAVDPKRDRFIALAESTVWSDPFSTLDGVWSRDATGWHQLANPATFETRVNMGMVYDPRRDAIVACGGMTYTPGAEDSQIAFDDVWLLDATWTSLVAGSGGTPGSVERPKLGYDPVRRSVSSFTTDAHSELPSGGTQWVAAASTPAFLSYAWDAKNSRMVGTTNGSFGTPTFVEQNASGGWDGTSIAPASPYYAVANERSGTIDLLPYGTTGETRIVRRDGDAWTEIEHLPIPFNGTASYNPKDGSLMIVSAGPDSGSVAAIRELVGSTPLESCVAGEDIDGDALAGCDDPDCYWTCSRCPPYTTCPPP